jgi:hypothetical protein
MITIATGACQRAILWPDATGERTTDGEAPPLLLARGAGRVDSDLNLLIALDQVLSNLLALLLNLSDGSLLLDDNGVHVLEHLRELDHLALDPLNLRVAVLDGVEGGAGLALATALHEGLAEDGAAVGVGHGLADFVLAGLGPHDAVLAGHLVLRLLAELRLDLLVLLDDRLEAAVDAADLCRVLG